MLERKLCDKGVVFTVNSDVNKMKELGITSVPVIEKDGELISFKDAVRWVGSL